MSVPLNQNSVVDNIVIKVAFSDSDDSTCAASGEWVEENLKVRKELLDFIFFPRVELGFLDQEDVSVFGLEL